ncbi:hypothetical protein GCM10010156_66360 [Planobispora rosea]|uniref:Phosphatidic acid phosphatase type 2/haloperoxidase domain-containing protein n=1 Tax=Planobispora rosea TaxID=35762 RepID=A0A8J3S8E6_PLARO|nr:hypothetical protein [Planobispora rosea]GGS98955.1 hypothetical protein GCM10010156_66360 [Planobispora rosea]GIH88000.1 hypothetical protein Pro02_64080 [Planobispora rosea]
MILVVLAHLWPPAPTLIVGALLVAVIGWARIRISHHDLAQTLAGALLAAAITWGVLSLVGL